MAETYNVIKVVKMFSYNQIFSPEDYLSLPLGCIQSSH